MKRLFALVAVAALAAGCGGRARDAAPTVALLTGVHAGGTSVTFDFRSPPSAVRTHYRPRSQIAESGSGRRVTLGGGAFLVVSFSPAATGEADANGVTLSYTGPKRLRPPAPGAVRELVKIGDFEAQLDWAIGVDRRRPVDVTRHGTTVVVSFG